MKYDITGDNLQMVNVDIGPGETLYSVSGAMSYMTSGVDMEARAQGGAWSSIKRSLTGASLFMVQYTTRSGGRVGIAPKAPGKVTALDMSKGPWLVQKTGFLGSDDGVSMDLALQKKLSVAVFGGEGLVLQRLSGTGTAFVWGCGDIHEKDLAPGETLKVSTSQAVAWEESVSYEISSVGGIKNMLFSGEGVFVTTLRGPGRVLIQSMTLGELALTLYPYMPQRSS